ncbi:hypothetical protein [Psychrobacter celer]|uniref:hypothetical protein n=1 Tax=Psychrobacter celer TaxID=306572 RepID=UPI003FD1AEEF
MNKLLASLLLAAIGTWSVIAFAVAPNAVDSEFVNQDSQVEHHKLMLAGYYEDSDFDADLDDVEYEVSDQAEAARRANSVLAKAYGRKS